jgi:hypothetical protein
MRGRTLSAFVAAAVMGATAIVLMAPGASAAPLVQHYHFAFTCSSTSPEPCPVELPDEQCDIPGTTVDSQWGDVQIFADRATMEAKERYTFTSALTGKSFESFAALQETSNTSPIDNGDGTVGFVFTFKGLEQQIRLPNGPPLIRDVGPIAFTLTLDAATGDFVSFAISEKHAHPIADAGYCGVVIPALA